MEIFLIEVRDTDEQFRTIRRGVRASLSTAQDLVNELLQEYVQQDNTISDGGASTNAYGDWSHHWYLWSNSGEHDLNIVISCGRMDTTEHRLWLNNEDDGKMFNSNEEMIEYLIENYKL